MARPHHLPPSAACLITSLRDLGYSLETAVADLIDNSISADATEIQILCILTRDSPVFGIIDNGRSMSPDELITAMKHGSIAPKETRSTKDLGRFGLGLKTASFSQCRRLTVLTAQNGRRSGAEWDLQKVENDDDWFIAILDDQEIAAQPQIDRLPDTGTMILWRDLDRLFEDEVGPKRDEIVNEKLDALGKHLSLVFHRFLSGDLKGRRKINITINGHKIEAFDPFCKKNDATRMLPEEAVWVNNVKVFMQAYILPHHSRLSESEYAFYQSRSDFITNQGAYVYRNGRLMVWGDWFKLVPKGEATKLARVQIDFPNNLDEAWTIDIKKSRARPPLAVRERLSQLLSKITASSVIVHRGRGQKLFQETQAPLWERYADHDGIRFAVNMQHRLVQSIDAKLAPEDVRSFHVLLESIAASLPVEMIYSDFSTNPRAVGQIIADETDIVGKLKDLHRAAYGDERGDPSAFMRIVRSTRLFDNHLETAEKYARENIA